MVRLQSSLGMRSAFVPVATIVLSASLAAPLALGHPRISSAEEALPSSAEQAAGQPSYEPDAQAGPNQPVQVEVVDESLIRAVDDGGVAFGAGFTLLPGSLVAGHDFESEYVLIVKSHSYVDVTALLGKGVSYVLDLSQSASDTLDPAAGQQPEGDEAGRDAGADGSDPSRFSCVLVAPWPADAEQPACFACERFDEGFVLVGVREALPEEVVFAQPGVPADPAGPADDEGGHVGSEPDESDGSDASGDAPEPEGVVDQPQEGAAQDGGEPALPDDVDTGQVPAGDEVKKEGSDPVVADGAQDPQTGSDLMQEQRGLDVQLLAPVRVEGGQLQADEVEFRIEALDDAPEPTSRLAVCAQNDLIDFGTVSLQAVGTYRYRVAPSEEGVAVLAAKGLSVDGEALEVAVTVSEGESDGTLYATTTSIPEVLVIRPVSENPDEVVSSDGTPTQELPSGQEGKNPGDGIDAGPGDGEGSEPADQEGGDSAGGEPEAEGGLQEPVDDAFGLGQDAVEDAKTVSTLLKCAVTLEGADLQAGDFTFELVATGSEPLPERVLAANDAQGFVEFGPVVFEGEGEYRYQVVQKQSERTDVVLDETKVDVTVTVSTDDQGALVAAQLPCVAFSNRAPEKPAHDDVQLLPATIDITTSVDVVGAVMNEGALQFKITLKDGAPEPQTTMAVNTAQGLIDFGTATFDRAGEYVYEIIQVPGETPGMTYDSSVLVCKVVVKPNDENTALVAKASFTPKQGFTNTYSKPQEPSGPDVQDAKADYHPASVIINASVSQLSGKAVPGSVELDIVDESGEIVSTGKNDANGTVRFESIEFAEAGTYSYTVQPASQISLITGTNFDSSASYRVQVDVEDTGTGLLARVSYPDGRPNFMVSTSSAKETVVPSESTVVVDDAPAAAPAESSSKQGLPAAAVVAIAVGALALVTAVAAIVVLQVRGGKKPTR